MDETQEQLKGTLKTGVIAMVVTVILVAIIILNHNLSFQKTGAIVLPAGGTYLGPSASDTPAPTNTPATTQATPTNTPSTQPAAAVKTPANPSWVSVKGRIYGYYFQAPKTLNLITLPNDPYDIYAFSWNNQPAQSNVLIGVDNLNNHDNLKQYVGISKRSYVEDWWKQFGTLKGVASITEFTNSQGLKGYHAKYLMSDNQSPNDDIFFEVTNHPELVIHLANAVLDKPMFDGIVDSVGFSVK